MSTLPFLLSVADELDNINSQSYMDDFGLGFHPHRQYYRTPTIQLSLPASTDWMQQERQRCRTHKFIDDTVQQQQQQQNQQQQNEQHNQQQNQQHNLQHQQSYNISTDLEDDSNNLDGDNELDIDIVGVSGGRRRSSSNRKIIHKLDEENIDNSVQMYNLSKKCCKNYYRHATEETVPVKEKSESSYKLQTKCMEGNNSSSDESLQKVSSSIEFLTCFLVKKTRISKNNNAAATSAASTSSMSGSAAAVTTTTTPTTSGSGNSKKS